MDVWYSRLDIDDIERRWWPRWTSRAVKRFASNVAKARAKDSMRAFDKLVKVVDGRPRLIGDPPLIVPLEELLRRRGGHRLEDGLRDMIRSYRRSLQGDHRRLMERYRFVDAARKVVGVGSVGTRAWVVLMLGNDDRRPAVPAGQGGPGLGAGALPGHEQVRQPRPAGRRGPAADAGRQRHPARLGAADGIDGVTRDFYVRQMWDGKGSAVIEAMEPGDAGDLRPPLRLDPGPGPRPLR